MRVGGPYSVTVAYGGTAGTAFSPQTQGRRQRQPRRRVRPLVHRHAPSPCRKRSRSRRTVDPVFSSSRTGAATSVGRDEIALIPTLNGRIGDVTRLTPQSSGGNFDGADNRMNNITVDGSTFNNSFGLRGQPGDTSGVAPISLEAIEQIQVSVAPFDVRQGSFTGAGVNTVTRSGSNRVSGSFYHRFRDQDWVGTEAAGQVVNPGTFTFRNTGGWASGPDPQEQVVRVRQLRGPARQAPAHDVPCQHGRRTDRRPGHACAGIGSHRAQLVPPDQLRLRNRPVRRHLRRDAGQALPAAERLQHQQLEQGELPLQLPRLVQRFGTIRLHLSASRPHAEQHRLHDLPELQLSDSREYPLGDRRVELGDRQQHGQLVPERLHDPGRKPGGARHNLPAGGHLRRRHQLHLVRRRAVHLPQRAGLQDVPGPGQLHQVHQPAHADVRRVCGEVPLGQHLHELLFAERLCLQLAGGLLRRRQRLSCEPQPHRRADYAERLPDFLQQRPG